MASDVAILGFLSFQVIEEALIWLAKSTSQPEVSALPPLKLYDQPQPGVTEIIIPSQATSKYVTLAE